MLSVVNGYLCYSPCQAAKARSGQNPNPAPGSSSGGNTPASPIGSHSAERSNGSPPASLADSSTPRPVTAAVDAQNVAPGVLLNRLA